MSSLLPALLCEAVFYLGVGFEFARNWFRGIGRPRILALLLWFSALLPYLIFAFASGTFDRSAFLRLAMLTGVLAFWNAVLPRRFAYDAGFLVLAVIPILLKVFPTIYRAPVPDHHIHPDILGHLMWIRLALAAFLILREWNPGPFGFWPKWSEWRWGAIYFLISIVPLSLLAVYIGLARFDSPVAPWWQVVGAFFGILWVVAFSEELFFRGVIERAILNRWRSPALAVAISAALYGCAHLAYHHFPDWRDSLVTFVLGIVCGIAYAQTGSTRTSMVTHALVVAVYRAFFR